MNSGIEFHDSSVAEARVVGDILEIFPSPAYIHRSLGEPGVDSGEGHVGDVVLRLADAKISGQLDAARDCVCEGELSVGGVSYSIVPLPFASAAAAALSLVFASGLALGIQAASVEVTLVGPTTYVEPFPA